MYLRPIFLGIFSFLILTVSRGEMISPLKIPLLMSANFGELRPNHFHSGIDLKTQGRIGLPVYAMDDGYVSRVVVSPWGFGRAVYINHSSGLTTVYGHLDRFAPFIDEIVRRQQYEQEDFSIDCEFAEGEIPVAQGNIIGYSGNSGSSGGPHLHLDIRDTDTQDPMDPQEWLSPLITDDVAPEVRNLVFLKSATKLFSVLLASKRPLITELADKLRLKYPLLPTISPCPTMRLEAIRSIIPISCRRYPKSV
jgi:hypothetical protein